MGKALVPQFRQPNKAVTIADTEATKGAQIGLNLRLPDGSVPTVAQLAAALVASAATPAQAVEATLWRLIEEKPANVTGLAAITGTGYIRRTAAGAMVANDVPQYIQQADQAVWYTDDDFEVGRNIIGVSYGAGEAFVHIPSDLAAQKIVSVKNEAGAGDVFVRPYSPGGA